MPSLETIWKSLTSTADSALAADAWASLEQHYTEPVRAYHNLEHLEELFGWAERLQSELDNVELVQWAIFYHDIIYLPGSGQNEDLSADVAAQILPAMGVAVTDVATVAAWIRASKAHSLPASADVQDARLFLDMDLAILGAPAERYQRYTEQIRAEYAQFSDLIYQPGRRKVLAHFIDKPRIYQTDAMHAMLDAAARKNLQTELAQLS